MKKNTKLREGSIVHADHYGVGVVKNTDFKDKNFQYLISFEDGTLAWKSQEDVNHMDLVHE